MCCRCSMTQTDREEQAKLSGRKHIDTSSEVVKRGGRGKGLPHVETPVLSVLSVHPCTPAILCPYAPAAVRSRA